MAGYKNEIEFGATLGDSSRAQLLSLKEELSEQGGYIRTAMVNFVDLELERREFVKNYFANIQKMSDEELRNRDTEYPVDALIVARGIRRFAAEKEQPVETRQMKIQPARPIRGGIETRKSKDVIFIREKKPAKRRAIRSEASKQPALKKIVKLEPIDTSYEEEQPSHKIVDKAIEPVVLVMSTFHKRKQPETESEEVIFIREKKPAKRRAIKSEASEQPTLKKIIKSEPIDTSYEEEQPAYKIVAKAIMSEVLVMSTLHKRKQPETESEDVIFIREKKPARRRAIKSEQPAPKKIIKLEPIDTSYEEDQPASQTMIKSEELDSYHFLKKFASFWSNCLCVFRIL